MSDCIEELLFFDTFAHDSTEEINLDLVQFPKPVYVTEVRIIPLGARVQADFPGGVRLGATNPSQFKIEFFVNDLGKPGASTFETLGAFEYDQNGKINLECAPEQAVRRIPTDGLVLKGLYTTITLAVYGTLTNSLAEQLVQPTANPALPSQANTIADAQQIGAQPQPEWAHEAQQEPVDYPSFQTFTHQPEPYQYPEYYADVPKDPRSYHQEPPEWEKAPRKARERKGRYTRSESRDRAKERDHRAVGASGAAPGGREDWERHGGRRRYEKEERKRPRSPPVPSPKRPHSPAPKEAPQEAAAPPADPAAPEATPEKATPPEEAAAPVDEFEPILSDEDIVDDGEHFSEPEFDYTAYTNNDDIIRRFVPGVTELRPLAPRKRWALEGGVWRVDASLRSFVALADDYFNSNIRRYNLQNFEAHTRALKEEFVHLYEKLLRIIGEPPGMLPDLMGVLRDLPPTDKLATQAAFVVERVCDLLAIGLDYHLANQQDMPAYKIRHIKCGVRLATVVSTSELLLRHLVEQGFDMPAALLALFRQDFMALSIKLQVLNALDSYLRYRFVIDRFCDTPAHFRVLVFAVAATPPAPVRVKFAVKSILAKLNLYECLSELHQRVGALRCGDLAPAQLDELASLLTEVVRCWRAGPFVMTQPERFLPVTAQFEIMRSSADNDVLVRYYDMCGLLECFLLLLSSPSTMNEPLLKTPIFKMLALLLDDAAGVRYLAQHAPTVNALLKVMLRPDEPDLAYGEGVDAHPHLLGLQLAYCVHALYCVDALLQMEGRDCDAPDVVDQLHELFCLTFAPVGRQSVGVVLAMADHAHSLLQFLRGDISKESPGAGYIVDLLHVAVVLVGRVPFLEKFSGRIRDGLGLVGEPALAGRVLEIKSYLLKGGPLSGDHVPPLLALVQEHTETAVAAPGVVVGALRALLHLGVSKFRDYTELKYKRVILQLFSLDGTTVLTRLLHKLCTHFEQPGVHSSIFASAQGLVLTNLIHPALVLLHEMLANVIQCRGTEFKDLTAVPVLLHTYNLLDSFPASAPASAAAQRCKMCVVEALLLYTQPVSDEESLSRTLWAQMVGEVIRFATNAPCTFVTGLLILSELLPLPLPMHTRDDLESDEVTWTVSLRKLWAAHLHPHSAALQDMIGRLCISAQPQLLNLLRRVCVQIADLAANAALLVARGFLDLVLVALEPRLLNFLACLVTHSTIKCAVLHLVAAEDKYGALLPAFAHVLQVCERGTSHVQAQECVLSIVQSFCDVELTLLHTVGGARVASEVYLANALPAKEPLLAIVALLLDHLALDSASLVTYLPIVRTFLLLTEHDYGFFHLRESLLRRDAPFAALLAQLVKAKATPEALSTLNTLVELLRLCLAAEEGDARLPYGARTIVLTGAELRKVLGWGGADDAQHPLAQLELQLKEEGGLETIAEGLAQLLQQLRSPEAQQAAQPPPQETHLPAPESLLAQYDGRIVYSSTDACDERLTARYWLEMPAEEGDTDLEAVPCDLFEICRQLPPEYNLIKEVEKLCRISRTDPPPSDKTAKHSEEQRCRTRKPFITPMRPRGFPRTAPQRPDLFRSRPPNTSRPPSLHVDDFVALETCGAQPTGPTGYNKLSREILASSRMARGARGRAFMPCERSAQYSRHMSWWGGPYF